MAVFKKGKAAVSTPNQRKEEKAENAPPFKTFQEISSRNFEFVFSGRILSSRFHNDSIQEDKLPKNEKNTIRKEDRFEWTETMQPSSKHDLDVEKLHKLTSEAEKAIVKTQDIPVKGVIKIIALKNDALPNEEMEKAFVYIQSKAEINMGIGDTLQEADEIQLSSEGDENLQKSDTTSSKVEESIVKKTELFVKGDTFRETPHKKHTLLEKDAKNTASLEGILVKGLEINSKAEELSPEEENSQWETTLDVRRAVTHKMGGVHQGTTRVPCFKQEDNIQQKDRLTSEEKEAISMPEQQISIEGSAGIESTIKRGISPKGKMITLVFRSNALQRKTSLSPDETLEGIKEGSYTLFTKSFHYVFY